MTFGLQRIAPGAVVLSLCVLTITTPLRASEGTPWDERADWVLPPGTLAPTSELRLVGAELKLVNTNALTMVFGGYELEVQEWDESPYGGGIDIGFCDPDAPFHNQPRAKGASSCSAFLVGPGLAVTAGHCIKPVSGSPRQTSYDCLDRYVVLNFSDYLTTPIDGKIFIPDADIRQCSRVRIDTEFADSEELPPLALGGTGMGDFAVLELFSTFDDVLPLVSETFVQSGVGDPIAVVGHPSRLPMKAESTQLEDDGSFFAHVLNGHSGSAAISLATGKVFSNLTGGAVSAWEDFDGPDGIPDNEDDCIALDFDGPGGSFGGTLASAWAPFVDPLGLQMTPPTTPVVEYYGPPTNGLDFNEWNTTLSVPDDSLPNGVTELPWAIAPLEDPLVHFDVNIREGTLAEGESAEVTFRPADWLVGGQAVHDVVLPIIDYTYGTREPLVHRVHVGLDGFTTWPEDAFDGEGLGAEHGETKTYTATNRWVVPQDMTVEATAPWVEFQEVGGGPPVPGDTPLPFTLPQANGIIAPEFLLEASMNGAGLVPDVYTGEITFTSLEGGSPAVEEKVDVYFDYCRDKTVDNLAPPAEYTLDPLGGEAEHTLFVPTGAGLLIDDIDVVVEAIGGIPGGGTFKPPFGFILRAPDGEEVEINDHNTNLQSNQAFYDDETTPGHELLVNFNGETSFDTWTLVFKNKDTAVDSVDVVLSRFEIRVHHQNVSVCTQ